MKILHALAGYLAVTTLPFHPFASAYPLAAIDYVGYMNTTQNHIDGAVMEHDLDSIAETVATQNHGDSALMKRVPGDIIEARQAEIIPEALLVFAIVGTIAVAVLWIGNDDKVRGILNYYDVRVPCRPL